MAIKRQFSLVLYRNYRNSPHSHPHTSRCRLISTAFWQRKKLSVTKEKEQKRKKKYLVACELIQVWRNQELPGDHEPPCCWAEEAKLQVWAKVTNWATDWLSKHRYEFPTATMGENYCCQAIFPPPVRSMCSVVLLWKWAKTGAYKKLDSLLWTKKRCSVLLVHTWAL